MDIRSAIVATLLLSAASAWAQETTLGYDAFVSGAKVGGAEVKLEKDDTHYAISGTAWTTGVLNFVTRWQSIFSATGRIADQSPINDGYRFIERTRDKVKELFFQNGTLTYIKNGHVRSPQTPSSLDLLSALFVSRDCASAGAEVHNGKDPYTLKLTGRESLSAASGGATERCSFELSNEDNERIDATVWLGQIDGLTVPVRLDVTGALEGTLKLHSTSLAAFAPASRSKTIKI